MCKECGRGVVEYSFLPPGDQNKVRVWLECIVKIYVVVMGREGRREEGREGKRGGGREGGKERRRDGGKEGRKEGGKEGKEEKEKYELKSTNGCLLYLKHHLFPINIFLLFFFLLLLLLLLLLLFLLLVLSVQNH